MASLSFIREIFLCLKERKTWWLVPAIILLILFGILVIIEEASPIMPFIYTLF